MSRVVSLFHWFRRISFDVIIADASRLSVVVATVMILINLFRLTFIWLYALVDKVDICSSPSMAESRSRVEAYAITALAMAPAPARRFLSLNFSSRRFHHHCSRTTPPLSTTTHCHWHARARRRKSRRYLGRRRHEATIFIGRTRILPFILSQISLRRY